MNYKNEYIFTVPEASKLLETKDTFVYGLVRKGVIEPVETSPQITISYNSLVSYLKKRIPSTFKLVQAF
jgi:hypothetical protein